MPLRFPPVLSPISPHKKVSNRRPKEKVRRSESFPFASTMQVEDGAPMIARRLIVLSIVLCMFCAGQVFSQGRWNEVPLPTQDTTLFRISFVDSVHGWIAGRSGVVLATTDRGSTWRKDSIASTFPIWDLKFVSPNVGWALAASGEIPGYERRLYNSTNAGMSWNEKILPDALYLMSISFTSDSLVRIGALDGHLWASTNGGNSWNIRSVFTGPGVQPRSLDFYDELQGYVGGGWGPPFPLYFQTTTDGGYTWVDLWGRSDDGFVLLRLLNGSLGTFYFYCCTEFPPIPLPWFVLTWRRGVAGRSIPNDSYEYRWGWATDSLNFWLLRSNGRIVRTTNGGVNWQDDTLAVPITELLCDTYGHRFAAGGGRLFRFDTETAVSHEKGLPDQIVLHQNYPNPFNPKTRIDISIPATEFITLNVYSILGQEVATLINEKKAPGTYRVEWDADRLASGMYFYRLQAGKFTETKKALLMK